MLTLRYKVHFFAGEQLLKITELKDIPVFKAKQIIKEEYMRNNKVTSVKLYAYGFEKRIAYKLSSSNQKWEVLKDE